VHMIALIPLPQAPTAILTLGELAGMAAMAVRTNLSS
jgi:hypothetical protein